MNDIIILYKNGIMKYKDETKISSLDIQSSDWFLIPNATSEYQEHRGYIMVKPTELFLFTNAIIEYQLCMKYDCSDDYFTEDAPINPISLETSSISDLIRMINCADKINISNNFIQTEYDSYNENIGLCYMGVRLYRNNKVIYDSYYELKGISSLLYDSYQVTKHFTDLYDSNAMYSMAKKNEFIHINIDKKHMTWNIGEMNNDFTIIGIPSIISNTIIFCTKEEYLKISKYSQIVFEFVVYFDKNDVICNITDTIKNGNYNRLEDIIGELDDVYCNNKTCHLSSKRVLSILLEVITNNEFIFSSINLVYRELYTSKNIAEFKNHDFDSILIMKLRKNKNHERKLVMNIYSTLSPTEIFSLL